MNANEPKPMTAKRIQTAMWWRLRASSELLVPRFTPPRWWECDLWRLTKAGLVDEYEIKITAADYRADFAKEQAVRVPYAGSLVADAKYFCRTSQLEKKHDLLAARSTRGPNRFWFVLPQSVADVVDIPEYAGLMVVRPCVHRGMSTGLVMQVVKTAPMLHREKFTGGLDAIRGLFYWRFWNLEVRP